jgi:hypothetical protein
MKSYVLVDLSTLERTIKQDAEVSKRRAVRPVYMKHSNGVPVPHVASVDDSSVKWASGGLTDALRRSAYNAWDTVDGVFEELGWELRQESGVYA